MANGKNRKEQMKLTIYITVESIFMGNKGNFLFITNVAFPLIRQAKNKTPNI